MPQFYFNILSDVPIVIGTEHDIIKELSKEPQRFLDRIAKFSTTFGKLIKSYGTDQYVTSMVNLMTCLIPKGTTTKKESNLIIDHFLNNLHDLVCYHYGNEAKTVMFALRILFLDRRFLFNADTFSQQSDIIISYPHCACDMGESVPVDSTKRREQAATKIQAFFLRIYTQNMLKQHQTNHKNYATIYDSLCKLYQQSLTLNKINEVLLPFFRKMLYADRMKNVLLKYEFIDDLKMTVNLQEFNGKIYVRSFDWNFISKYVIHCTSKDPILLKIVITCNLQQYVIKIYDNDTKKEMKFVTKDYLVENLRENANGYTVIAYGWSDIVKEINWKITFVTPKEIDNFIYVQEIPTNENIFIDNYMSNLINLLFR